MYKSARSGAQDNLQSGHDVRNRTYALLPQSHSILAAVNLQTLVQKALTKG